MNRVTYREDGTASIATICSGCREIVDREKAVPDVAETSDEELCHAEVIVQGNEHGIRYYHAECFWKEQEHLAALGSGVK